MRGISRFPVLLLALVSCNSDPVDIKNCAVTARGVQNVVLRFDVRNNSRIGTREVRILMRGDQGGYVNFQFDGNLPSGIWVNREVEKPLRTDGGTIVQRTQPVTECYAHAVIFVDGSAWDGGVPL